VFELSACFFQQAVLLFDADPLGSSVAYNPAPLANGRRGSGPILALDRQQERLPCRSSSMPGLEERMADVPAPRGGFAGSLSTLGELPLGEERRAVLAPKLAAVLTQFRQIEVLERPDVEPAPQMPERWDGDEHR
jgi:hypothetical protein